ncbi:MAG: ADP-ribosylglycohydrolase family protein [Rivularia sp. (in: cyanobacteria)]
MRYSLTSRVRGALIGGLIGQSLAATQPESYYWIKVASQGMESLIAEERFYLNAGHKFQQQEWNLEKPSNLMLGNIILATLPIAIFFHENNIKLRENLLKAIESYHHPYIRDGVLAVCYLIAQSLNEKIDRQTNQNRLVSEITSFIGETTTDLPNKLQQVNNLIVENAGYSELQNCLGKENNIANTIAIAFYCFATTKEDFRLTCLRATTIDKQNSEICAAIAGAVSGAYNSMAGIPITWHLGLDEAKLAQWGITNFSQMVKLADALVSVWSGAYHELPQSLEAKEDRDLISPDQAIAAPYIIRLR